MADLYYDSALRGRTKMDPHAIDKWFDLASLADSLHRGHVEAITLDPGDSTAYDLILCPLLMMDGARMIVGQLLVARTRGKRGAFVSACTFSNPIDVGDFAFGESMNRLVPQQTALNGTKMWEYKLLDWWLRELWELL